MEKNQYPLQQLATIKQKKLEEAEKTLLEKKRLLAEEEKKLAVVEGERDKVKEHRMAKLQQLREKLDAGTTTDKIQQMKQYLKVVDEQLKQKEQKVKEQQKNVQAAQAEVEAATQDLYKKQQAVEKLALHRKEWDKEQRKQIAHEEAIETDEMGSAMHNIRKQRKKKKEE